MCRFNCNCKFYKVQSATVDGNSLILSFANPVTANDKDKFSFVICTVIPSTATPVPVLVTVNGANIPLLNKFGNPVFSNEIRNRKLYVGYYGSQATPHIIIHNIGCDTLV